jgi:RNA polymerase sigma-70 factor (ECF subfamily)
MDPGRKDLRAWPAASPPPADEALVARVLGGDVGSFEVLMRRFNARVYRTVRALIRDEAEVEDIMQQAYLAAFARLGEFRGEAAFSTWLLRIAHNEARSRLRRALHAIPLDVAVAEGEEEMVDSSPRPDDIAEARELTRLTERAVDALPETLRTVFMLRGVQGLSAAEVADVLGVSVDVVKQRLHRAREAVREQMIERMDERLGDAFEFRAPRCDRVVAGVLARLSGK